MAESNDRKNWVYVEITPDQAAALRRMSKAEGKPKDALVQEIGGPAIAAEVDAFVKKETEAATKAAAEKQAADEAKAAAGTPEGEPAATGAAS